MPVTTTKKCSAAHVLAWAVVMPYLGRAWHDLLWRGLSKLVLNPVRYTNMKPAHSTATPPCPARYWDACLKKFSVAQVPAAHVCQVVNQDLVWYPATELAGSELAIVKPGEPVPVMVAIYLFGPAFLQT